MKRFLCCLIGIALLSLLAGCGGGKPAPIKEGGADGLSEYLNGSSDEDYLLTENAEFDLSGAQISSDRTLLLREGITLKLFGMLKPGEGNITVRAEDESGSESALDLSELKFEISPSQEAAFFDVRSEVRLVPPQEQELLLVDSSSDEWISIKSILPQEEEPEEPQDEGPQEDNFVSTPEEFLQAFGDPSTESIELDNDIAVELIDAQLAHDLTITLNGNLLTLSGELDMNGGTLHIGEKPETESGTADISGLTVTCGYSGYTGDFVFIGLNFKNIIGEPKLGEGMRYEIPDSGEHASIKLEEVITPEMHEAKLNEEMTQYLSGIEFSGGVGISEEFLADGVLEINLDNPVIDKSIGVGIDGGMTLILTGSVTFDGGIYGFEINDDSTGTVTVDISALEINGTEELGSTKSNDIVKITGEDIDFIYNKDDPHIKIEQSVGGKWYYLRYVK